MANHKVDIQGMSVTKQYYASASYPMGVVEIPDSYVFRVWGFAKKGDFFIGRDGLVQQWVHNHESDKAYVILDKKPKRYVTDGILKPVQWDSNVWSDTDMKIMPYKNSVGGRKGLLPCTYQLLYTEAEDFTL